MYVDAGWTVFWPLYPAQFAVASSAANTAVARNARASFMSCVADRLIWVAPIIPRIVRKRKYKPAVWNPGDSVLGGAVVPAAAGSCTVNVVDTAPATGATA